MPTIVQSQEWSFEKAVICFNCKNHATQVLSIQNEEAIVTCTSCNAFRHYVIRSVIHGTDTIPTTPQGGRYEPWEFKKTAICSNCQERVAHSIHLDDLKIQIVCKECGFTRIYKFNFLEVPGYNI